MTYIENTNITLNYTYKPLKSTHSHKNTQICTPTQKDFFKLLLRQLMSNLGSYDSNSFILNCLFNLKNKVLTSCANCIVKCKIDNKIRNKFRILLQFFLTLMFHEQNETIWIVSLSTRFREHSCVFKTV